MISLDNKQSPYIAEIDNVKLQYNMDPKMIKSVENGTYDKDMALLGKVRYVVVGVIAAAIFLVWIFS